MKYTDLKPGDELPVLVKDPVTHTQLVKYAGASGDYNLIHVDAETAKSANLGGIIAHGMLSMGSLGQFLTGIAGAEGVKRIKVKFGVMVRLQDVITCKGVVKQVTPVEGNRAIVELDIWAENQRGEKVTTGDAEVYLSA